MSTPKLTPMMQQYLEAKERFPDALLFFRMGDFYELFFEDAEVAARELQLTLTSRNKSSQGDGEKGVPMAGVPHHAAQSYISQLTEKGFSVAICEQLEDPSQCKGIVKRDVIRVVTPGLVFDNNTLDSTTHNFIAAIFGETHSLRTMFGVAFLDVSTGTFRCSWTNTINDAVSEVSRGEPRELLVNAMGKEYLDKADRKLPECVVRTLEEEAFDPPKLRRTLKDGTRLSEDLNHDSYFLDANAFDQLLKQAFTSSIGKNEQKVMSAASTGILGYVVKTQRGIPSNINRLEQYECSSYLVIDDATRMNLELTQTLMGGQRKGSLLSVIDKTVTPLGARLLRHWLAYPSVDVDTIEERFDAVNEIFNTPTVAQDFEQLFKEVFDLERLCGRLTNGTANARDLKNLERTLEVIPAFEQLLKKCQAQLWRQLGEEFDPYESLRKQLKSAIVDDPPTAINEGGLFKRGYNPELDEIIELSEDGKSWMLRYETSLKEESGINSLKIRYNKVFGYFIEVTKANLHLVPDTFIRKQTLVNCERYFTEELKEKEEKILHAKETRQQMELQLFQELRLNIASWLSSIQETAHRLAIIDVLTSFATLAHKNDYHRPTITQKGRISIRNGRHPVVEKNLKRGDNFIPNDIDLDTHGEYLQIITGPNMSGKSTVIRQVALIVIMAQMGCFVPSESAEIGIVDKVFSRVGASDNLARGESTFMVEMTEAAQILKNATSQSLIILDEIGRGTSTFDGLSIAWAVAEYIHDDIKARTMFATHYHELTELTHTLNGAVNMSIAAKEWHDDIIFLRKLVKGEANRSYGIQVGRLAGLPDSVIERAKEVLENLESTQFDEQGTPLPGKKQKQKKVVSQPIQLDLFAPPPASPSPQPAWKEEVLSELASIDVNQLTPIQAITLLAELKSKMKTK